MSYTRMSEHMVMKLNLEHYQKDMRKQKKYIVDLWALCIYYARIHTLYETSDIHISTEGN